jgi:hypothetical protein
MSMAKEYEKTTKNEGSKYILRSIIDSVHPTFKARETHDMWIDLKRLIATKCGPIKKRDTFTIKRDVSVEYLLEQWSRWSHVKMVQGYKPQSIFITKSHYTKKINQREKSEGTH